MAIQNTISQYDEMIAYETLFANRGVTQKKLIPLFNTDVNLPSEALSLNRDLFPEYSDQIRKKIEAFLEPKLGTFNIMVNTQHQYPDKLHQANHSLGLFYYRGDISLLENRSLSIVGARSASEEGKRRAVKLSTLLAKEGFTIVSGLAYGIDTAAHVAACRYKNGRTIGVIGTPIDEYYPKENRRLQDFIAENHLLISEIPFYRYHTEPFNVKRFHFPQRNITMSAISEGTIIIEASDKSGSLTQARECLRQGRKLFILRSCLERKDIKWPRTYVDRGATVVNDIDDILGNLE